MGALYHLKQRLVDFANVVQENLNRSDTVPSSKVLHDETTEIKESLSTKTIPASDVFTPSAGWTLNSASYVKYDDYGNVEVYLHLTASPAATTGGRYPVGTFSKYHPNSLIYSTAPTARVNNGALTDIVPVIFGYQPQFDNYTGQDVANIGIHLNYFTTNI